MNALLLAAALLGTNPHSLAIDEVRQIAGEWFPAAEESPAEDYAALCDALEAEPVTIDWVRWWAYYWQNYAQAEHEAMTKLGLSGLTRVGYLRCCCNYGLNNATFMSPFVPQPTAEEAKPGRR
jgi:hypothetical protein